MGIIIFFILAAILLLVMHREHKRLTVTTYQVASGKLPKENNGFKIVLLSDLHNNQFGESNKKLLEKIEQEKPDVIMIAGDMLVGHTKADNSIAVEFMKQLASTFCVFYANGNHEQRLADYPETCDSTYLEYTRYLKKSGIKHLINQKEQIKNMEVYGLEIGEAYYNKFHRPKFTVKYLEDLLGKPDKSKINILIAHNPMYFREYAQWGADLVLSGHIHGGIVNIPKLGGVISPQYVFFPEYDGGRFTEGMSTLILSRGLGMHTIKLRLNNPPEIVSIILSGQRV